MNRRLLCAILALCLLVPLAACGAESTPAVMAATKPIYDLTAALAEGTEIPVRCILSEPVSCLHDYTLSVTQMRALEGAPLILRNGLGLDDFLNDAIPQGAVCADLSAGIALLPGEDGADPHIWLDPDCAAVMAENACAALTQVYPEKKDRLEENLASLLAKLDALKQEGAAQLASLSCRKLITFHDGFAYFARAYSLALLASMEEEHGSEIAASDLAEIVHLVQENRLPAIFTEAYGSDAAAKTVQRETGTQVFALDLGMGDREYFSAMRYNFETLKEALG